MVTAWLILAGTREIRSVADLARFGARLFQILAPLQLALAIFFSALMAASAVAQEKDRHTLVLLLLTNLSNSELVLGKLLAGMLTVLVLLGAALPLFMLSALFGGVAFEQIGRVFVLTLVSGLAAGSLGSTLALWREKTFQTLALTVLGLVFWMGISEAFARGLVHGQFAGAPFALWAQGLSPYQAVLAATRPAFGGEPRLPLFGSPVNFYITASLAIAALLNALAVGLVRVWNPPREARAQEAAEPESIFGLEGEAAIAARQSRSIHAAPGKTRQVWQNPILWREVRTWAYGRRVLVIRLAYLALFAISTAALVGLVHNPAGAGRGAAALALVPLMLLSLVLVNAQAVTALTSERDVKALDLLLVTDISAKEFVFGKLGGIFYNTKEMVLLPLLLCGYLWLARAMSGENALYLAGGLAVMNVFVATLGVHAGMTYENSRTAIGVSLGTVFFLFVGVATCMRMLVAFSGAFHMQLTPFLAVMFGGGVGLYVALGSRNPSPAIQAASFILPIATFYAITSFLLEYTLGPFLVIVATYAFTTAAMLVPAIFEFDVATGRTTSADE